jgi:site-specific recombinase XerD
MSMEVDDGGRFSALGPEANGDSPRDGPRAAVNLVNLRNPRKPSERRARRRPIDVLSPQEVLALMRACSRRAPTGVRNAALIGLMYGAGLRVSEALDLELKDLDLDELTVTVQNGKGDKRRVVALMPDAVAVVARWLDRREALRIGRAGYVFCTLTTGASGPHPTAPGGRLSREYVGRFLRHLAKRAGISKRVHPHGFRHSHADLIRRRGFDVEEVRRQLGQSDLAVTTRYLDHLGASDLPDRMRTIGSVFEPRTSPRQELQRLLGRLDDGEVAAMVELLRHARDRTHDHAAT